MTEAIEAIATNSKHSIYDLRLGATRRPLDFIKCIAYNGSYWLAGSSESALLSTYESNQEVENLRIQYENYLVLQKEYLLEKILSEKIKLFNSVEIVSPSIQENNYNWATNLVNSTKLILENKKTELETSVKRIFTKRTVHTMAISYDGFSWEVVEHNPFSRPISIPGTLVRTGVLPTCNSIAWNGSMWVAVGHGGSLFGTEPTNQIATSLDGKIWTMRGSAGTSLQSGGVFYNYRGICNAIATSSTKWVVVGERFSMGHQVLTSPIATSVDGINWLPVQSPTDTFSVGNCVAYNGAIWVVGLRNQLLTSSDDAVTWITRMSGSGGDGDITLYNSVAWNGSHWLVSGTLSVNNVISGIISKSVDGLTWQTTNNTIQIKSLAWDGNFWNGVGDNISGIYTSQDGIIWTQKIPRNVALQGIYNGYNSICTKVVLPILGGTINQVETLVVGYDAPASVLRSFDNIKWLPQAIDGSDKNFLNNPQKEWNDVIWTGSKWILVGEPTNNTVTRTLAISSNGIDWSFPYQTEYGLKYVADGDSKIIAVGGSISKIVVGTSDGLSWALVDIPIQKPTAVAWNSSYWLIGGDQGIIKSTNSINWSLARTSPLTTIKDIAWNGYLWIAVGEGLTHSIAISINGIHWFTANPDTNPFTSCTSLAWNKSLWIAVGEGSNTIATSIDGYTWTGLGTSVFLNSGSTIYWNGTKWIASGTGFYSTTESIDGITWSPSNFDMLKIRAYKEKTIRLPYTGTTNETVLTTLSLVSNRLITDTNEIIENEEDEALALAEAEAAVTLRNSSVTSANGYKDRILVWKPVINLERTIYTHYKSLNLSLDIEILYPNEFTIYVSFNDLVNEYNTALSDIYSKVINANNSQTILNENVQILQEYADELDSEFPSYCTNRNFIVNKILQEIYDSINTAELQTELNNPEYIGETKTQNILTYYAAQKSDLLTSIQSLQNTLIDTPTTSIYTAYVAIAVRNNVTKTNYTRLFLLDTVYRRVFSKFRNNINGYVRTAVDAGVNWGVSDSEQTIRTSFSNIYYNDFNGDDWVDEDLRLVVPRMNFIERYYKLKNRELTRIGRFPTSLISFANSLILAIQSVDIAKNAAIQYALDKKKVISERLAQFKIDIRQGYNLSLQIDTYLSRISTELINSNSELESARNLEKFLRCGGTISTALEPLLTNVLLSDLQAEEDGAKPPLGGWGSSPIGLSGSDIGVPGISGWIKFNETYRSRSALSNFISSNSTTGNGGRRVLVGPLSGRPNILLEEYLRFAETYTYDRIVEEKTHIESTISVITSSTLLSTSYIDSIALADLTAIDGNYPIQGESFIDSIKDGIVLTLPTAEFLELYGEYSFFQSPTLQASVDSVNGIYSQIVTISDVDLSTKTKTEIVALINSVMLLQSSMESHRLIIRNIVNAVPDWVNQLARVNDYVSIMEDRIDRAIYLITKYQTTIPFNVDEEIADGNGQAFISGIIPSDTVYWTVRTHPVVTYNGQPVELTTPLGPLLVEDYPTYSSTDQYELDEIVVFNTTDIYQCTNVGKFDGDTSSSITNVVPTNNLFWRKLVYPLVTYEGNDIEAVPSLASSLNYLQVGYYDANWLYFIGDMTAYNGTIYECTNVTPPVDDSGFIVGILPTVAQNWQLYSMQLSNYNIPAWNDGSLYAARNMVEYDGYLYQCEHFTPSANLIPNENSYYWRLIPTNGTSRIPIAYSNTSKYAVNEIVSYRSYNSVLDKNQLLVYICYKTDTDLPQLYTYPTFSISDAKNSDDDYIIVKDNDGTYLNTGAPRYSPDANEEDPFRVLGLARGLRRRVAMYIEMPYLWAFNLSNRGLTASRTTIISYGLMSPEQVSVYQNQFNSRISVAIDKFENAFFVNSGYSPFMTAGLNVYASLIQLLKMVAIQVKSLRRAVNTIKNQYFNHPYVQKKIFNDPYKFLNEVAASIGGVRQFRDLGVGEISVIRGELDGNETNAELDYYNTHKPRLDALEEQILYLKFFAETIVGHDTLFKTMMSTHKIGSRIRCESSAVLGIYSPIADVGAINAGEYENPNEFSSPVLWYITEVINGSTMPPEYVTDSKLAAALTYELQNPIVRGLARVTKGIVGLTAAAFQGLVPDPFMINGLLNMIDSNKFPIIIEVKWPNFRQQAESRNAYKKHVNILKDKLVTETEGRSLEGLNDSLIVLGAILIHYSQLYTDIKVNYKPLPGTNVVSYTTQIPDIPPVNYMPPATSLAIIPDIPPVDFTTSITSEIKNVKGQIDDIEQQKRVLLGKRPKPPIPVDIPTVSNNSVKAMSGSSAPTNPPLGKGKYFRNGIPIDVGGATWRKKIPTETNSTTALPRVGKPTVTQIDVDLAKRTNELMDAEYQESLANYNKQSAELEVKRVNKTQGLQNLDRELSSAKIDETYANAKNQNATLRAKETQLMKSLDEQRLAKFEYDKAVVARKIAIQDSKNLLADDLIQKAKADIDAKGLKVTQTKVTFDAKTVSVTSTASEFTELIDNDNYIRQWIDSKIPTSVKAKYNKFLIKIGPLIRFNRAVRVYLRTRPAVLQLKATLRKPKVRKAIGALGGLAAIAGAGVTAWQDGAFDDID